MPEADEKTEPVGPYPYAPSSPKEVQGTSPWFRKSNHEVLIPPLSPELHLHGIIADFLGPPEEAKTELGDLWNFAIGNNDGLSPRQLDVFTKIAKHFGGLDRLEESF